jgi:hypothetical protein
MGGRALDRWSVGNDNETSRCSLVLQSILAGPQISQSLISRVNPSNKPLLVSNSQQ